MIDWLLALCYTAFVAYHPVYQPETWHQSKEFEGGWNFLDPNKGPNAAPTVPCQDSQIVV